MASLRGNGNVVSYYDTHGNWQVCVENDRNVGSYGIFNGDRPLDFVLPISLCQLVLVILISRTLHYVLRPLKTPKFICSVLGGIILGPTFLGRNKTFFKTLFPPRQAEYLILASVLGAVYFIFFIALKMDVRITLKAAKSTWRLGIVPFLAAFSFMFMLLCLHYNPRNVPQEKIQIARVSISLSMAVSNFPVVSDAMIELNLIATELGQMALSSAMINDQILWLFLVLHRFATEKLLANSFMSMANWVVFMFFCVFVLRPAMELIVRRTPVGKPVREVYVVLILVGVLVMSGVGDMIGETYLMGPLMFGLIVPSGPPLGSTLVEKSEILVSEFLLPFFFVYVGFITDLSALRDWRLFLTLQSVFFAADAVKLLACVLVSYTYSIRPKHGTVLGLAMNIKGITQLIGFTRLKKLQLLDDETFSQLVICVVVITMIVTPLINYLYKHRPRVHNTGILYEGQLRTIQSASRTTEFRIICCIHNEGNVRGMTSLLESLNPVPESPICVYAIHLIELLGKSSPILLPINLRHNKRFLSVNYPNTNYIMRAFGNYSHNSSGPVMVLPYVNVAPYKSMHDSICNLAQDKLVPLIIIPFHENDNADNVAASVRKMNAAFQAYVPCTLGILVDRYSRLGATKNPSVSFNLGVFFLGGSDDREALALAIRMLERVNTRVALFRFIMNERERGEQLFQLSKKQCEEEEADLMLDEGLVDEFKNMKYKDCFISCYEIMVNDGVEVLDAVRRLEGDYDLVMVGRRHTIGSLRGEEMASFIENAEVLGVLGDMLSSTEFCIGMVPVLVTQCGGMKLNSTKLDRLSSANASQRSFNVTV